MAMQTDLGLGGHREDARILRIGETYVLPAHNILRRITPQSDITESALRCDGYGIVREVFEHGKDEGLYLVKSVNLA